MVDINEWKITYNDGVITFDDVLTALNKACEKFNMDISQLADIDYCNSNKFNSIILSYVNSILFKPTKCLYTTDRINNSYDKNKILSMVDIYIYLCTLFDKCMNVNGFNSLCGIDNSTLYRHDDNGLNLIRTQVVKSIMDADNIRQQQRASDSKQAILNLAYNNYIHSWNGEIKSNEIKSTVKTLADIKTERVETSAHDVQNARFSLQERQTNND